MRRFLRILLYTVGGLLLLLVLVVVLLQTPWGKNLLRTQAVAYLRKKLNTEIVIANLDYSIPDMVKLEGVLIMDQRKDTLLAVRKLQIDMDMLALLSGKLSVNQLALEGVNAHVYRIIPDTAFNYNFIVAAFAGGTDTAAPTPDTAASKPMQIDVAKVALQDIRLRYDDATGGTFFYMNLGNLLLRPRKIDTEKMMFEVKEFRVDNLQSYFATDTSYLPPTPPDTAAAGDFGLVADKVHLGNVQFSFLGKQDSMFFGINAGLLETGIKKFALQHQLVAIDAFRLENVTSSVIMGKPKTAQKTAAKTDEASQDTTGSNDWEVTAGNLLLKQVNFAYDDNAQPRQKYGMDYAHLNFQGLSVNGDNIYYTSDTISGNLKHLALNEQCGLQIIELRSAFLYHNQGASLANLYLQTPGTILQHEIAVQYPSIAALQTQMERMRLHLAIEKSKVSIDDILLFMQPAQRPMLAPYTGQTIYLGAAIDGYLNALRIASLEARGLGNTELSVKGIINGLPDADKLRYDLTVNKLQSSAKDVAPFVPDSLKRQIRIPDWFAATGHITGSVLDYYPDLNITTSDGNALVRGKLLMSPGTGKEIYDLALSTHDLNLGRILRQDSTLGKMTLNTTLKGTGFDVNKMNTSVDADVSSLWAMGYGYSGMHLTGNLQNKQGTFKLFSTDPNINLNLDAWADLSGKYPAVKADLDMANLNPQALKLYSDTLQIKGKLHADFPSLNPDYPVGNLTYGNPQLRIPGYDLKLDSIIFSSAPDADSIQNIYLNAANILHLSLTGHIPLTQIGAAALSHVNNHYKITADTNIKLQPDYSVTMNADAVYHPVMKTWLPTLKPFDTVKFAANINPTTFNIDGSIPRIVYGTNRLDSGVVKIYEAGDTLRYNVSLKRFRQDQMQIWYPTIRGGLRNDSLYTRIIIRDSLQKDQFAFGAAMNHDLQSDSAVTHIRVFPGLLLNYEKWAVNPQNQIKLATNGFNINNLAMTRDNESLVIQSKDNSYGAPFNVAINGFKLSNLTAMLSRDTLIADGLLNANADIDMRDSFPKFNATASIDQLTVYNQPMGKLGLNVANEGSNTYNATVNLTGNDNDVSLAGSYFMQPVDNNQFKFDLNVNALSLKSVQGLAFGSIKNSSGFIRGQLAISGTAAKPQIIGQLKTDQLTTTVSMLNAPFTMPSETVAFTDEGIALNNFKIQDKYKKSLVLDGDIKTTDYTKYFLNLKARATRWTPVNSTKQDNEMFYGKLVTSANLHLAGLATAPTVDGQLTIHDSTKITYAMTDDGPAIQETDGVVRFLDGRDTTFIDSTQIADNRFKMNRSADVNVNVSIDKAAQFTVLIDPATGDQLMVSGAANLNTELAADGTVGLTGTYELNDGFYELHYNLIKRKFKIQPGSSISLAGDPLDAEADITAVYEANIAPYELVQKQVDQADLNLYRQRMPFQILLKIKGKVMQPTIAFDIILPENNNAGTVGATLNEQVQAKLAEIRNEPSTLNKQVFAALILGRFVTEDPFESMGNGGLEYAVRQSASRFLSDQLNNLAGQLIQGLELNVDLQSNEDYSTGSKQNRTDLSIAASKRLFSDRLKITVGNDFQVEGQQAQSQQSALIPGNLSAEYQLTKDGRYLMRAYRVNQLQNIVDGYVIETGVSLRLNIEYNRFKTIFQNRERMRRLREQQLEEDNKQKQNEAPSGTGN
ncbi:MAG: translocation/assembly module TamB domain-containing protein [Edaphocola sp.]